MTQVATTELEDWFRLNISRGCSLEQLHESLLQAGYEAGFARDFLRARGGAESATAALKAWWGRCAELAAATRVDLGDRVAQITGRHVANGIFYLRGVLSSAECDALIEASAARIQASTVVDPNSGDFVPDTRRTSQGTHFERAADPVVAAVERRLAVLSGLPEPHGEGLQILHYRVGGEYRPHFDYFDPATPGCALQLKSGGQRLVTIILYLNEVDGGGSTVFPELGLEFLPEKGAALMFASLTREGALQRQSLHGGSPVTAGVKWIATRWIRVGPYL